MLQCVAQRRSQVAKRWLLVLCCVFGISTLGCGDGRGVRLPVSGQVLVDGKPLKHGSITFMPIVQGEEKSRPGGSSLDSEGRFKVTSFTLHDGLLAGDYEVFVLAVEPINETSQRWHAPSKYSNAKTSGLKLSVTEETDSANFDLSWKGEDPSEPYVEKF